MPRQIGLFESPEASRRSQAGKFLSVLAAGILAVLASPVWGTIFATTNLVTDDQTVNAAQITDPNLKNGWGVSRSPGGPFWVSSNGAGISTLYRVNPFTNATTKVGLEVTIPGDGNVTGQVFSGIPGSFNGNTFLFVSEDGTISGWRGALGTNAEVLQVGSVANVYKGTSEATTNGHAYLYSANFATGKIDVLKGDAAAPNLAGTFTDPTLPAGYAPFDIANLDGKLYVTYALQNGKDDLPGAGHGFVSVFDLQGNFLSRVGSQGTLNSPWGLAIAPLSFGEFAGDLLVGNFGDGTINVFDTGLNAFLGQLLGADNKPLVIDGLWGLIPGNNGNAGNSNSIYFAAGPGEEAHGLFGVIFVPEPATLLLLGVGVAGLGFSRRRNPVD